MHVSFYEHNICINSSLNNKKRHEICRIAGVKKKAFFPHCIVNYTSLENAKHKMRQRCNFAENPTLSIPNVIICSFRTWLILILFFFIFVWKIVKVMYQNLKVHCSYCYRLHCLSLYGTDTNYDWPLISISNNRCNYKIYTIIRKKIV